jgi:hypothetical protein
MTHRLRHLYLLIFLGGVAVTGCVAPEKKTSPDSVDSDGGTSPDDGFVGDAGIVQDALHVEDASLSPDAGVAPDATVSSDTDDASVSSDLGGGPGGPAPKCRPGPTSNTIWCDNGIIRVRTSEHGITWFDFFHPRERRWYVAKNNINLNMEVAGEWQSTEIHDVTQQAEVVSETADELVVRLHFGFPHGARVYTDLTLEAGSSFARFELHAEEETAQITGVQWHITFGQAEAVSELHFDGNDIYASDLPTPFDNGPLEVQHKAWFSGLTDEHFHFWGEATDAPDPANPSWMSRVLGLKQHVIWETPMRDRDLFMFEARDQPWQPHWGVPATTPWIEGLWFVRRDTLVEGDTLVYGIDNVEDYR